MESAVAVRDLERMGRSGVVNTMRLVVEFPPGTTALDANGWAGTARLASRVAADPRVAQVRSLPSLVGGSAPNPLLLMLVPDVVRRSFISRDERATMVEVVPRESLDPRALTAMAREWRAKAASEVAGPAGTRVFVGGLPAFNADYQDAVAGRLPLVISLVLGGTLIVLFISFRSVLVPIKAVVLNLLSVVGAFGAVVLVFQDGIGASLIGVTPADGLFPAVPILVFCIVFGLSMDYEVFLIARVAEARRAGADDVTALATGLAHTGGVITSAAAIMVVVFAAFTLGEFLLMQMLGFALAAAVFLDATIVRIAVGPALLRLAGRWNWWPGERRAR
jgi:RND superfamily putative drug exporter